MTIEVKRYEYDEQRERRWREIVDRYSVLAIKSEAEAIAPRLVAAGAGSVLEVGSHRGPVAEALSPHAVATVCLELDREIVRSAHRPAVRGSADWLPFGDGTFDAVTAMNVLYFLERPETAAAEARRVLRPGGLFVACTQQRDNDPELREVAPGWGAPSSFDGENAEAVMRSAFDDVSVEPWEMVAYRLPTKAAVIDYVEVFYQIGRAEAEQRCAGLEAPLEITKKGLFVWATKP